MKVRAKVVATIGTVDHDFVLPNHDVCALLGCPLQPNKSYTYKNSMFVSQTYPSVGLSDLYSQQIYLISFDQVKINQMQRTRACLHCITCDDY